MDTISPEGVESFFKVGTLVSNPLQYLVDDYR